MFISLFIIVVFRTPIEICFRILLLLILGKENIYI